MKYVITLIFVAVMLMLAGCGNDSHSRANRPSIGPVTIQQADGTYLECRAIVSSQYNADVHTVATFGVFGTATMTNDTARIPITSAMYNQSITCTVSSSVLDSYDARRVSDNSVQISYQQYYQPYYTNSCTYIRIGCFYYYSCR